MTGILRLSHLDVRVPDLDLAVAYYAEVVGLVTDGDGAPLGWRQAGPGGFAGSRPTVPSSRAGTSSSITRSS